MFQECSCEHCLEFYKKGVFLKVKSHIDWLEKGSKIIESDDLENNENDKMKRMKQIRLR